MSSVTIYLIRHATTPMVGKGLTGWLPGISLDDAGRRQAEGLANRLGSIPFSAIYSSPLERTVETAQPLARRKGIEIQTRPEFGELNFGDWQGKFFSEIELDSEWRSFNVFRSCTPAPGGEMMLETQARFVRGMFHIAATHRGETIAIFSHADAIKAVVAHILGIPIDFHLRLEIGPASVTVVQLNHGLPVVQCLNMTEQQGTV